MRQFLVGILIIVLFSCSAGKQHRRSSATIVRINVGSRRLTSLPDSVFSKQGLTHLIAGVNGGVIAGTIGVVPDPPDRNQIQHLPEKICGIETLRFLDLEYNTIDTLPACFTKLQNLEILDLSFNIFLNVRQSIPIIMRLKKLKELRLFYVPQAFVDSNWVREQFAGRDIKLSITEQDMFKYYGRHK